jgi:predicted permease
VVQDLRHAVRFLLKSKGFTLVAVAALAVGIGANVTLFGFVSSLVLRPMDAVEPERLVRADSGGEGFMTFLTYGEYVEYRTRNQSLSELAIFYPGWMAAVRADGPAEMIAVTPVSGNYFATLGVTAALGRAIAPEDDEPGAPRVVVLSDAGFRRHFGADKGVLGRTITIDGEPFTIVGVLPPSFPGTAFPNIPQIYAPFHARAVTESSRGYLIGRLRPGVTREEAQADLSRIAAQRTKEEGERRSIRVHPATRAFPQFVQMMTGVGALFFVVAAAVLWNACSNIAVLLLARGWTRRREIGIRLALGASRPRLVRQLLVESLLLASAGGLGAIGLALFIARWLTQLYLPVPMPIALLFDFDWRVVVFTGGAVIAATLLFGLGPALQSLRADVVSSIKQRTEEFQARGSLVVTQVALSTALLSTAGLLVRSLVAPPERGFDTDGVLMATVRLGGPDVGFFEEVLDRLEKAQGVISAAVAESVDMTSTGSLAPVEVRSETAAEDQTVYTNGVSRGYFRTLGIPLLGGRDFEARDDLDSPAIGIVNETLARRFWPGRSALGRRLALTDGTTIEAVGLAPDIKHESLEEKPAPLLYLPLTQRPVSTATFLIKTTLGPRATAALVRERVAAVEPNLVVYNLQPLEERFGLALLANRALAWVSGVLGLLGLTLGAIGTYGIVSFLMEQRRREIGIRIALGATPSGVVGMTTRRGMLWTGTGIVLGVAASLVVARLLQAYLNGIDGIDPIPLAAAAFLLAATGYAACLVPARRASRTDPMAALRE